MKSVCWEKIFCFYLYSVDPICLFLPSCSFVWRIYVSRSINPWFCGPCWSSQKCLHGSCLAGQALAGFRVGRRQAEGLLTEASDTECSWQLWNRSDETNPSALIANWHINMYCVCRGNYIQGSVYYYEYQHLAQAIWGSLANTQPWISI